MNEDGFKRKFFRNFLISYSLILLIPVIIGSVAYNKAVNLVEEGVIKLNITVLEQTRNNIEKQLERIDSISIQINKSSQVISLLASDEAIKKESPIEIFDVWNIVQSYSLGNEWMDYFYLYFKNPEIFISKESSYINQEYFYEKLFKYGNLGYSDWKETILDVYHKRDILPATQVVINGIQRSMIPYLQSVPIDIPSQSSGAILVLIDEREIHDLMHPLFIDKGGWAYIYDRDGQIITSLNKKVDEINTQSLYFQDNTGFEKRLVDGEIAMISYVKSLKNGLTYVAAVPTRVIMERVDYIKRFFGIIGAVILISGISFALFMAYRNSRPIMNLIRIVRKGVGNQKINNHNAYNFLQESVKTIIDNNQDLQNTLELQKPILTTAFFDKLFRGEFNTLIDLKMLMQYIPIYITGSKFVVMLLSVDGYSGNLTNSIIEELNVRRILIKEIVEDVTGKMGYLREIEIDKIAVLICINEYEVQDYKKYLCEIIRQIEVQLTEKYNIILTFGIGSVCESLIDVSRSYNEAKQAMNYKKIENKENKENIIWYDDIVRVSNCYYYAIDIEVRLMNLVKAGEKDELERLLKDINEQNFVRRSLSFNMVKQLISELKGTLYKVSEQINIESCQKETTIEQLISGVDDKNTIHEAYECITDMFKYLCNIMDELKKSHKKQIIIKILQYIDSNYMIFDFSLCKVADRFSLTEVYLSKFFKEQTGENFSCYVERLRMQAAVKMLEVTELTIEDITQKVGYVNSHVFRTAFKRKFGVSPSSYKNSSPYIKKV